MKTKLLTGMLLLSAAFAGAQGASVETSTTTDNTSNATARQTLCMKGCMARYDSSELACRIKSGQDAKPCIDAAQRRRRDCERNCFEASPKENKSDREKNR